MDIQMRKKRIEILKKIDALTSKCKCQSAEDTENCSNCKEIKKLGKEIEKLSRPRSNKLIKDNDYPEKRKAPIMWTDERIEQIKKEHHLYTYKQLANRLKVPVKSLSCKMNRMGIKCKITSNRFRYYENDIFVCEGTVSEISEQTGYKYGMLHKYVRGNIKNKEKRMEPVE